VPGHPELPHDEDVEGRTEPPGYLERNRDAASRECEHESLLVQPVFPQALSQVAPGLGAIAKGLPSR
jgi:hypothetical protein